MSSPEHEVVEPGTVTLQQAVAFANNAFRNWDWIDDISADEMEDLRLALQSFARTALNLALGGKGE